MSQSLAKQSGQHQVYLNLRKYAEALACLEALLDRDDDGDDKGANMASMRAHRQGADGESAQGRHGAHQEALRAAGPAKSELVVRAEELIHLFMRHDELKHACSAVYNTLLEVLMRSSLRHQFQTNMHQSLVRQTKGS